MVDRVSHNGLKIPSFPGSNPGNPALKSPVERMIYTEPYFRADSLDFSIKFNG